MPEIKKGLFYTFILLLLVLNLRLIDLVFSFKGDIFVFELLLFIFLGLMAADSMNEFAKKNHSCFSVLAIYFAITMLNSAGLAILSSVKISIFNILIAGIGFILSVANITKKAEGPEESLISKDIEKAPSIDVAEEYDTSELGGGAIVTEYYPGKYLASKTGKKYHSPKCDFAKKIPKRNQVWFDDKGSAKKEGYVPCKCV